MINKDCTYSWKNTPRIITYTNPKQLKDNLEIAMLMKNCVQLCASDTLMQGLISKYDRKSFGVMCSINHFQEWLFDYELTGTRQSLQMFLDVKKCIHEMPEGLNAGSVNYKNAFDQNVSDVVEAFRFLAMTGYVYNPSELLLNEEQEVFFEYIYEKLVGNYREKYEKVVKNATKQKVYASCCKAIGKEVERLLGKSQSEHIDSLNIAKKSLENAGKLPHKNKKMKQALEMVIEDFEISNVHTVVIHGVLRFTPEIMRLIEVLDNNNIKIVFLINYCLNLEELYGLWKRAYEWVGCEFEYVSALNLNEGRDPGRSIAEISLGKRVKTRDSAKYRRYYSLTDFTDVQVRHVFEEAQQDNKKYPLSRMKVQYYSVNPNKANEILRNYFPEQFMEKPFMAYPVGQFIRGLFEMWDFESGELMPDFNSLKDCSIVKIAHSRDDMFNILNKIALYFENITSLKDLKNRADLLLNKVQNRNRFLESDYYLSFYDVTAEQIEEFINFVDELNQIGESVFGTDAMKQVDYQKKFAKLIHEISMKISEKEFPVEKELQLLAMLEEGLKIEGNKPVVGGVYLLKEAMMLFLQTKQESADAEWIVRGFDQLDGAPLMKNPHVDSYEITGLSMKNMTKSVKEILPWPLDESIFHGTCIQNLYSQQAQNIIRDRNNYLKFYLYYVTFFGEKDVILSYIENENGDKQRPYYLLSMLGLVPVSNGIDEKKIELEVCEKTIHSADWYNVSKRERDIFSICPYKYFLTTVVGEEIRYCSDYHVRYFLEMEATRCVSKEANYRKQGAEQIIDSYMAKFQEKFPFFDDSELSDVRRFIWKNFLTGGETSDHIQKKRDFLIAAWEEDGVKYMNYKKTSEDVYAYLDASKIMPMVSELPHKKICQECCFNGFCLNAYYDKEVDI